MVKKGNFSNNGARFMEFGSFGGGWDGDHNGDGFRKIVAIFVTRGDFYRV